tara:strand:+ start:2751 stop:4217 length:1467 start_codon:yes stop_codon:yes gene_type:complete
MIRLLLSSISNSNVNVPSSLKELRYGKSYVIASNTDTYSAATSKQIEIYSLKYGVRSTVFEFGSSNTVIRDVYTQGVFEESIYFRTDMCSLNGVVQNIPDYESSTYTSSGAAVYPNINIGDPKLTRYPNMGTQMMFMTDGADGVKLDRDFTDWDKGIGSGNNPPFDPESTDGLVIESEGVNGDSLLGLWLDHKGTSSQHHKTISYRNGQQGTPQLYQKYVKGGRTSVTGGNVTGDYFDDLDVGTNYPSSTRLTDSDMTGSITERVDWIKDKISTETIPNGGFYRNFTHWHSALMSDMEALYIGLEDVSDDDCWFSGMSECIEYSVFKNAITSFNAIVVGDSIQVYVRVDDTDLTTIVTPVNIEVDVTGTPLEGVDIVSSVGEILSLGSNRYLIEVFATNKTTTISEGVQYYLDTVKPSVLTSGLDGSDLTVTTDQETKMTLFSDESGTVIERKYNNDTTHVFNSISSGTYYLGVINNTNRSIIETIIV